MTNKIILGEINLKWDDSSNGSQATFLGLTMRISRSYDRKDLYEGCILQTKKTSNYREYERLFESPRKKDINKVKEILTERFLNHCLPNYLNDTIEQQCSITFGKELK